MYDPTPGRWTTEDPIGFKGRDPNLYRYVRNSPTNYIDPSGLHLIAENEYLGKEYLNWLRGGKDNIFSAAHGGEAGPGLTDKQVVTRTLPNGAMMFLTAEDDAKKAVKDKNKYKGQLGSLLSSIGSPINVLMSLEKDKDGPYVVKGEKMKLRLKDVTKESLSWIQAWVNSGGSREKTEERSGPNVTYWFAADLMYHMKHRIEHNTLEGFRHQAADLMTYKWIDFSAPAEGRGVTTVVLGKTVVTRNELGNIALLVIASIWPPDALGLLGGKISTTTGIRGIKDAIRETVGINPRGVDPAVQRVVKEKVKYITKEDPARTAAVLGYAIIPEYRDPYFGKWQENSFLWRADNLVAFGVGTAIANRFLEKINRNRDEARKQVEQDVMTDAGRAKLVAVMEETLNEFFDQSDAANKRLSEAAKLYADLQPDGQGNKITGEALSFNPAYGGFNLNSLKAATEQMKGRPTSIAMAGEIKKKYDEYKKNGGRLTLEEWRVQEYEHYDRKSGIPFPEKQ